MKFVANISIPEKAKPVYDELKTKYSIETLGCKVPIGLIAIEALRFTTDLLDKKELKLDISKNGVKFVKA